MRIKALIIKMTQKRKKRNYNFIIIFNTWQEHF